MVPLVFLLEQRLSLHDCMGQLLSMIKAADAVNLENNINVQKYFGVVTDLMYEKTVSVLKLFLLSKLVGIGSLSWLKHRALVTKWRNQ